MQIKIHSGKLGLLKYVAVFCSLGVTLLAIFIVQASIESNGYGLLSNEYRYLFSHVNLPIWITAIAGISMTVLIFAMLNILHNTQARAEKIAKSLTHRIKDSREKLKESEYRWRFALEGAGDGLWDWNLINNNVYFSVKWKQMLGYEDQEMENILSSWSEKIHPEDYKQVMGTLKDYLEGKTSAYYAEHRLLCKDNSYKWILARGKIVGRDKQGKPLRMMGTHTDISDAKNSEEKMRLAASVFTNTREGILISDQRGKIIEVNNAFTQITGYTREEVIGKNPSLLKSGSHDQDYYRKMWQTIQENDHWTGEIKNRRKNGEIYTEMLTISVVKNSAGEPLMYLGLFSDISVIKEHQKHLEHIAHYDALTGLPNRYLLADRLGQAMLHSLRHEQKLALAYIDLDGFKYVNDTYGHDVGDKLLVKLANRMRNTIREGDTIARLGGDEFIALLPDFHDTDSVTQVITRILESLREPAHIETLDLHVSASIGVTFFPQGEEIDADQLLRQADQAMYHAKISGKNRYNFYDANLDQSIKVFHESLVTIRNAVKRGDFELWYQPQINMRTGEMLAVEALLRWRHPEKGILAPESFLSAIENHQLGTELSEWVLREALNQSRKWKDAGLNIRISVNIMAIHLRRKDFTDTVKKLLTDFSDMDPSLFIFEIQEASVLGDLSQVAQIIEECANLGVQFALDDFGTSYSSITYLRSLRAEILKIDRSFIGGILQDTESLAMVESALGLSKAYHRLVIAEGVETIPQGTLLLRMGCENAQGYCIARPMIANQIPEWLNVYKVPTEWAYVPPLSDFDFPLAYAKIEHKSWLHKLEKVIGKTAGSASDFLLPNCRMYSWESKPGNGKILSPDEKNNLMRVHKEIHSMGANAIRLGEKGDSHGALRELQRARKLIDSFPIDI